MEYNKRQFNKTSNKKVLHKVKKNWVVVSMALLSAIGGGAAITHANAVHADTNAGNQSASSQTQSSVTSGVQLKVSTQSSGSVQSTTDPKAITHQANNMYKRVLGNATQQAMHQSSGVTNQQNSASVNGRSASANSNRSNVGSNRNLLKLHPNSDGKVSWNQFVQHHNYLVKHNLGAQSHEKLGDADTGQISVMWIDPGNNNKQVKVEPQSDETGQSFSINQFLMTAPAGFENPRVDTRYPLPTKYLSNPQTAFIDVSPIPAQKRCIIKINYLNKDASNEEEKHLISSDTEGTKYDYKSDLLPAIITPPDGYNVWNFSMDAYKQAVKDPMHPKDGKFLGDVNPATIPTSFQPGLKQINIEIVPKGAPDSSDTTSDVMGKPIYVSYINQHGVNVNTQSDDQPVNGKKGSIVNITDTNPIPAGYQLAYSNEEVKEKIGSDVQNVKINVTGQPLSTPDTFTIHRTTNNGQTLSDATMPINGSVGDSFNVDPNTYVPSGYHVDENDNGYTGTILANGLSQNSIQYVYDANNANQKSAQPIYVKYYNQNGQVVNTSNDDNPINGTLGANVNVTNDAPVPTGYTLDKNQNTNRTISNNPQNVSLFVTGDKASDTFTIHRNENVVKSDGTPTGKTNKLSDVSDNIQGLVGDNEMIYPSAYMPSGDQMTTSDEPIQVTIMPNGKLAPANSAQFTYNKSANGKSLPSNIVNGSIVYEDKDNNNHILSTQIPISGVNGSKVDYGEYYNAIQQNVPSDFYLIKPLNTNATLSNNGQYPYQVGEYGYVKVEFIDQGHNMDINSDEVRQKVGHTIDVQNIVNDYLKSNPDYQIASKYASNVTVPALTSYNNPNEVKINLMKLQAQPITVNYVNQANDTVTSKQITGDIDASGDVTKNVPVPDGYNLNPNQNTNYKIGKQAQNMTLHVTGQKLPQPIQFVIHRASSNGQQLSDKDVPINGSIGDHYQVDPAQAQNVPNGYYASNGSQVINGTILPGDKLSTNGTTCTYTKKPVKPTKTIVPVTITYVNQNGDNVNTKSDNAPIKVDAGSFISDIVNDAPVPAGYTPNGSDRVAYNVGNQPMKISLKVTGNKLSSNFMIHRSETKVNFDGQSIGKAQQLSDAVVPVLGQVGNQNTATIDPAKYMPQGDKLTTTDQPITVTLGNDGKLTPSSSTQFSYDKPVVTSLTANIQYEDEFSHKIIKTLTDKGDKNSPINYSVYEKASLPSDYEFIKLGNHNQNIESNGENDVILVAQPATGQIVYKDINNNDKSVGSTSVNGYTGQVLTNAQYQSKVPAGYEYVGPASNGATLRNNQAYPVLVVEAGKNNSGSLIKANAQIVYEDADNNNAVVKTAPISGLAGSHIDYSGYQHQVPAGYSYAGMGDYNDDLENNGRNVILVAENGNQHNPKLWNASADANILYEDVDNQNNVVSTQHVSGIKGSHINYRNYTEHVPAGYTLVGMGDYDDNLENGENNVIYVAENGKYNQPSNPSKVSAQLVYENINDNDQPVGSTVDLSGVAGTAINYDTYKNSPYMPAGYHFVGMGRNDSNLEKGDTDYMKVAADGSYNSGSNVAPTSMASNNTTPANSYATTDLMYVDNNNHTIANQAVTGEVGTPIDYSSYVPAGYVMTGNVIGSRTYQNNGRDYIYVEPLNNSSVASSSAVPSTTSSVASVSTAPASSAPASSGHMHAPSDEASDSHDDSDDNGSQSIGHRIAAKGANNYENNSNALGINHNANRYGNSADALGINSYPGGKNATAGVNEANVGGANGTTGSNNGKLPQTGEANSSKKAIAAALLAISATLGALDAVVRRRRDND